MLQLLSLTVSVVNQGSVKIVWADVSSVLLLLSLTVSVVDQGSVKIVWAGLSSILLLLSLTVSVVDQGKKKGKFTRQDFLDYSSLELETLCKLYISFHHRCVVWCSLTGF